MLFIIIRRKGTKNNWNMQIFLIKNCAREEWLPRRARMNTELLNDKGDYLQQQKQLNPTTIALGTTHPALRWKTTPTDSTDEHYFCNKIRKISEISGTLEDSAFRGYYKQQHNVYIDM